MTLDEFWQIIGGVHRDCGGDMDVKCALLAAELRRLSLDQLCSFEEHFAQCEARAYDWGLWAAAEIISGGMCTDDPFWDFRSTLISMGRETFDQALQDPQSLADLNYDADVALYEGYQYVSITVREELGYPAAACGIRLPDEPSGKPWDAEELAARYPKLVKKYGDPAR